METTLDDPEVTRLSELLESLGRHSSLRDPLVSSLAEMEFTGPQLHALLWLGTEGPMPMGQLAQRLGITEKTVTGLVDRMEARGHVYRERDEHDRRVVLVRLTESGADIAQQLHVRVRGKLRQLLDLLSPPERENLFGILDTLNRKLDELRDPAPAGD